MARLFSAKPKNAAEAAQFQSYFKKHGRYTAGVETRYDPSLITATDDHQHLASGLKTGMRFHSAPVIRLADGKPMELGHTIKADGRWRLIAFAGTGDQGQKDSGIANLCGFLSEDPNSPVMRYAPKGAASDSVFDLRAVFQGNHRDLRLENLPKMLLPTKGCYDLIDYEKAFCPDLKNGPDIFDHRGIDRQNGVLLLVRPDQFTAKVQALGDFLGLAAFFDQFMIGA